MKAYKTFDLFSQLLTLAVIGGALLFDKDGAISSISLLTFAGLQIISLLVHASVPKGTPWRSPWRKYHTIGMLVVLAIIFYGMVKPTEDKYDMSGLGVMVIALIPAAIVALLYTVITFLEYKKIQ
jgi:hypothetical protein